MKKLVLLFVLLAVGLFASDVFAMQHAIVQGVDQPDNWYISVEYNGAEAATHGCVMEWDVDSDTGETLGYTVHKCDADDAEIVAGVVPAWNDYSHNLRTALNDGDIFCMQIHGYHSAVATDDSVTEGQGIQSDAGTNGLQDGEGFGFAFKSDASDLTTEYTGEGEYYAPVWIDFMNMAD